MCTKIFWGTIGINNCHTKCHFGRIFQMLLYLVSIKLAVAVLYLPALLHISETQEVFMAKNQLWIYCIRNKNTWTSTDKVAGIYDSEDLLYLWCKSVQVSEKHTARAMYLLRTIFNIKHISKIIWGKNTFPTPKLKNLWYAHIESQALIVKFRQQRKSAIYIYNFVDKDVCIQFKDQKNPMQSN